MHDIPGRPGARDLSDDAIAQILDLFACSPEPPQSARGHALGQAMAELDCLSADLLRLEESAQRIRVLLRNLSV